MNLVSSDGTSYCFTVSGGHVQNSVSGKTRLLKVQESIPILEAAFIPADL